MNCLLSNAVHPAGQQVISFGVAGQDHNLLGVIAGSVAGAVALLCVLVLILLCTAILWRHKRRHKLNVSECLMLPAFSDMLCFMPD